MERPFNIVVSGVGGQGIITIARLIVEAAVSKGFIASSAETYGLSQRGGTVVVTVRIGRGIFAPTIPKGMADLLISTELVETLRYLDYLRIGGVAFINRKIIFPALPGSVVYYDEEEVLNELNLASKDKIKTYIIPASKIAEELGVPQSTNIVMLGAATPLLKTYIDVDRLQGLVSSIGRGKVAEMNARAFLMGIDYVCKEYRLCI